MVILVTQKPSSENLDVHTKLFHLQNQPETKVIHYVSMSPTKSEPHTTLASLL